ncbi:ArsR/SmtB family transcription factor [Paenibacillus arenilitoris]|uniref:Winged helix-turn-helix transcriptional regulator n=1 Tax=Paenibacillus arenilitoris TaxID=2772299 RepID=A0A927CS81_9BACL|nr:metalloregulator ArsR/SmtB family transcription factor [Paenibacillus arenilitoris]MBD2871266.1 winged helix-turn-helix transcriptional regulator [Paenibacillus arenilitoris]
MDAATFSALAEQNRLRIVELLLDGPLTVGEIADRLGLRQPQASKHLKVLLEAGLVEVHADANRRHYKLLLEPLRALDGWLETFRHLWNVRFDNLENYLQNLKRQNQQDGHDGHDGQEGQDRERD